MQAPPTESTITPPATARPLISVLMSVYNGERYLAEAIESVLAQTERDFELIVVDDGSSDDSWAMVQGYMRRDPRVKGFTQANTGVAKAMNAALPLATGEFIAKMDADDVAAPDRFATTLGFLRAHPDHVAVGSSWEVMDADGRKLTVLYPPTEDGEIQRQLLAGHCPFCHSTAMVRHDALREVGGYSSDIKWAEDQDLFLKLGEVGKLANLTRPLVRYRVHEKSVSARNAGEQIENAKIALRRAWERRGISDGKYEAGQHWRPGDDADSRHDFALLWGWWAYNSGEHRTAMHYARKAIGLRPLRKDGWKLLACAALKRPTHSK